MTKNQCEDNCDKQPEKNMKNRIAGFWFFDNGLKKFLHLFYNDFGRISLKKTNYHNAVDKQQI